MREKLFTHTLFTQVFKFASVGVLNTILDAVLYFALTRWLGFAAVPLIAKAISYTAGIVNSYVWNRSWTFKSTTSAKKSFLPFVLTNLFAIGINGLGMHLCLNILRFHEAFSFLLATAITFVWTFTTSKLVVFAERSVQKP
jgi:putative flippase GtrA